MCDMFRVQCSEVRVCDMRGCVICFVFRGEGV